MEKLKELYHYQVYGLHIASEIILSELIEAPKEESVEVSIIRKEMPSDIKKQQEKGIRYHFELNDIWYEVEALGTYRITNGNLIEVDCSEDKDLQDVKAYLLGTAFGCLMAERQQVAIHGGSIVINDKCMIFTGESGAGKSTLTTTLRSKGNKLLADDVSVTGFNENNQVVVQPAYPQQKLCRDAMKQMGYNPNEYVKINEERDKYLLPVRQQFVNQMVPLGGIVEISIGKGSEVQLEEVRGKERLEVLFRNIYRRSIWEYLPMPTGYFKQCLMILKQVPVYKLQRPEGKYTVEAQIELLMKTLQEQDAEVV